MTFAPDYIDVPTRIAEFREKYPDGRLRPVNPDEPFRVVEIGNHVFIAYTAAAYRASDDPLPGIGTAWEPFPGKTSFTRDSELQNAETSAWGRAIIAALAADSKKGIATAEDVRNRDEAANDEQKGGTPQPASEKSTTSPSGTGKGAEGKPPNGASAPEPDLPPELAKLQERYEAISNRSADAHAAILADKRAAGIGKVSLASDEQLKVFEAILAKHEAGVPA